MTTDPLSITSPLSAGAELAPGGPPGGSRLSDAQETFSRVLNKARGRGESDRAQAARDAAVELVAITLVQPVLAQLRETNNAAAPFGPTPAERQFGTLQDARVAQDIVRASKFPLVDQLAQRMLNRLQPGQTTPESQGGRHERDHAAQPAA